MLVSVGRGDQDTARLEKLEREAGLELHLQCLGEVQGRLEPRSRRNQHLWKRSVESSRRCGRGLRSWGQRGLGARGVPRGRASP